MAKYVDGFVLVVPNDKTEEYKKMAEEGRDIWMKLGALEYYECSGNDMIAQDMGGEKARTFPEMAGAKSDETVWFSFIVFKSKEHRDEVNAKMIEEMSKQMEGKMDMTMPFDMKRMAYGGFQVEVESS
jgi:uncharacterized protein YbaA (DUF1428 family)